MPLIQTYVSSFYGAELVSFDNANAASLKFLRKSVNLAYMRALKLPRESVSQYLIAEGILNADAMSSYRSLCFWKRIISGSSPHQCLMLNEFGADVVKLATKYKIFPSALGRLSKYKIHCQVVESWGTGKDLFPP